ncbi:MAG: hypothetical protein U0354_17570 [Candidatus Sericytochromatia bacterium]
MKIDNNIKINNLNEKDTINISSEQVMSMLKDKSINKESLKISNNNIVLFEDNKGNSYRAELTKEQVQLLQKELNNEPIIINSDKAIIKNDNISIIQNKQGSAQKSINLFEEPLDNKNINNKKDAQKDDNKWDFKFQFGYNRTKYFDTEMHLKSSRLDVTVKDFSFKERTSSDFYNPKNWEGFQDAFRWIDEPTNSFILNAENKNNVLYFTAFHPKFLKQDYQEKPVTGTVDGVQVDKVMPINEEFDGYNNQPGEMHLVRFESTHKQMDWQVGYGRNITLLETQKAGKLVYTPSVHVGVTTGKHLDVYLKPNEYWEFNDYEDKTRIQGANFSVGNRLMYEYGRFNAFVENRFNFSHLEHQFMDGKAEYNMKYTNTTFGVGMKIFETKGKPKIPE